MAEDQEDPDARREILRVSGQFMGHGLTWALSVLLFMGVGAWLDSKVGTAPVLMVLGAFVGGGAGFYSLYAHIVIDSGSRDSDPK